MTDTTRKTNKVERNKELENRMMQDGVKRYNDHLRKAREYDDPLRGETDFLPGQRVFSHIINSKEADLVEEWKNKQEDADIQKNHEIAECMRKDPRVMLERLTDAVKKYAEKNTQGRKNYIHNYLRKFQDCYEVVAFASLQFAINGVYSRRSHSRIASELANFLEDQYNFQLFEQQNKAFFEASQKKAMTRSSYHVRRMGMKRKAAWKALTQEVWKIDDKVNLGSNLLELVCDVTGLVEIQNTRTHKKTRYNSKVKDTKFTYQSLQVLVGTALFDELINSKDKEGHMFCQYLKPFYRPIVIPPKPWTSLSEGGYHSTFVSEDGAGPKLQLIKTDVKAYLQELEQTDISHVLDAVNIVQNTAWRINKRVLEVMTHFWNLGGGPDYGLPYKSNAPLPPCPLCGQTPNGRTPHGCFKLEENAEIHRSWKMDAGLVHDKNHKERGKRTGMAYKLEIARQYADEEELYFPHKMDFRGRIYPIPTFIHPQMDDTGRSLLEFAKGKHINKIGLAYLKVHGANCYEEVQVSPVETLKLSGLTLQERVQWVDDNIDKIKASAENPYDNRWWLEAEKPYLFLAFCFDLSSFYTHGLEWKSHLPVAIDGSCNGLQHFAAMLRDPDLGRQVNLRLDPDDPRPGDIYTVLADAVSKVVAQHAEYEEDEEKHRLAQLWNGKITRKIVKRPCMTYPYGGTRYGFTEQIAEVLETYERKHREPYILGESKYKLSWYLANVVMDCLRDVIPNAFACMETLKDIAREVGGNDLPVRWATPIGFPVVQDYRKKSARQVKIRVLGKRWYKPTVRVKTKKVDRSKAVNAMSPNFVHSMDASHLMETVLRAHEAGINDFGMVHDSFATHACRVADLGRILRETFVEMYQMDRLNEFKDNLIAQIIDQKLVDELALVSFPEFGTLDIESVLNSPYFFA